MGETRNQKEGSRIGTAAYTCAVLLCVTFGSVGTLAENMKVFGNWAVHTYIDRFSDKTNVVALALATNKQGNFAVRCIDGYLSIGLSEFIIQTRGPYQEGDIFSIALRVDRQRVIETSATAISDKILEIVDL